MLGPGDGARRRHDQAAELVASPDPHHPWGTGDDQRTRLAATAERRYQEALAGFHFHCPDHHDRAVKAPPTAGLDRPRRVRRASRDW